jgi:hypothetical protein
MQSQGTDNSNKASILQEPEHLLAFIKNALTSDSTQGQITKEKEDVATRLGAINLHIARGELHDIADGDSDDEDEQILDPDIASTAINLLLAVLEGMLLDAKHTSLKFRQHTKVSPPMASKYSTRYLIAWPFSMPKCMVKWGF